MIIKKTVKKLLKFFNYQLTQISVTSNSNLQLVKSLENFNIDLLFDIGANTGQFAEEILNYGYKNIIISFEPLTSAHAKLLKNATNYHNWIIYERCAIGDIDGKTSINISENSVSSSILEMTQNHLDASINSIYIGKEDVNIFKIDTIIKNYKFNNLFLKIDAQGFENHIINGSLNSINKIKGILCETSLVELYKGQLLWKEMITKFENLGFKLWAIQQGYSDPRNGQSLQLDLIFYRD
jgi:FkbM family methyltransferase